MVGVISAKNPILVIVDVILVLKKNEKNERKN
jgi:hypothetical protein